MQLCHRPLTLRSLPELMQDDFRYYREQIAVTRRLTRNPRLQLQHLPMQESTTAAAAPAYVVLTRSLCSPYKKPMPGQPLRIQLWLEPQHIVLS